MTKVNESINPQGDVEADDLVAARDWSEIRAALRQRIKPERRLQLVFLHGRLVLRRFRPLDLTDDGSADIVDLERFRRLGEDLRRQRIVPALAATQKWRRCARRPPTRQALGRRTPRRTTRRAPTQPRAPDDGGDGDGDGAAAALSALGRA